jgi:ubiquinone biosynthesis protein
MFHADPHPGNVFVAPGEKAHIIDWGMVGRMDRRLALGSVSVILNLSQNDGMGLAKAWIELGRATSWANIPGFINDLSAFVPKVMGASLETLDFGVTLSEILRYSSRRGIQTPPAIGLLGKAFANIEGSVRYLAPELSIVEVFEDELQEIIFAMAQHVLSEGQAAKAALEAITAATTSPEQSRSLLRDLSNRELTVRFAEAIPRVSRREDRADRRARDNRRALAGIAFAVLWAHQRRGTR